MVSDPQNGMYFWLENLTQGSSLSAVWIGLSLTGTKKKMSFWMTVG